MFDNRRNDNKNTIFIDIDDTIANTRQTIYNLYERITGGKVDLTVPQTKYYSDSLPMWTDDDVDNLFRHGFTIYNEVKPIQGAVEAVNALIAKGYDVRFVTMNYPESIGYKQKWMDKYFPSLAHLTYYVNLKAGNKDVFCGYAIIDDDIKNISTNSSNHTILFDSAGVYDMISYHSKFKTWREIVDRF